MCFGSSHGGHWCHRCRHIVHSKTPIQTIWLSAQNAPIPCRRVVASARLPPLPTRSEPGHARHLLSALSVTARSFWCLTAVKQRAVHWTEVVEWKEYRPSLNETVCWTYLRHNPCIQMLQRETVRKTLLQTIQPLIRVRSTTLFDRLPTTVSSSPSQSRLFSSVKDDNERRSPVLRHVANVSRQPGLALLNEFLWIQPSQFGT